MNLSVIGAIASAVGDTGYHYGYPAYGAVEPDVEAQWLFDEGSGSIVDEVSSITLTVDGSPTFNVTATGDFAGVSPGITYAHAGQVRHKKNPSTDISIGTSDFTFEWWFKTSDSTNTSNYLFFHHDDATKGIYALLNCVTRNLNFSLKADDGTNVSINYTLPVSFNDGALHKYRWVCDRSGNGELFVDGTSVGTQDISGLNAKAITLPILCFGSYALAVSNFGIDGTFFEFRISFNLTNNSGGPNGG